MGVFTRPDSKYYWLWLPRKDGKGLKERTNILANPEQRDMAEKVYRQRMKDLAAALHFAPRRVARERTDLAGWTYVYFVSDGEFIKIGRAVNVLSRLRAMQVGSTKRLTVLATMLAHHTIEGVIQQQFRDLRVNGEWFRPAPHLLEFIDRVKNGKDVVSELAAPFAARSRFGRKSA